jgi:hypothetical protein
MNKKYAPRTPAPTVCEKYIVLRRPIRVNAICQISDIILCRCTAPMPIMREKIAFELNMVYE